MQGFDMVINCDEGGGVSLQNGRGARLCAVPCRCRRDRVSLAPFNHRLGPDKLTGRDSCPCHLNTVLSSKLSS